MEDSDIPRAPIDPAKLTPEVIAHVQYKILQIVWGGILRLAPLLTLLIVGLAEGLLIAIPVYLMVRMICVPWRLWRKGESPSRKQLVELPGLLLGATSLATANPLWFQMEIPVVLVLAVIRWGMKRKPLYTEIDLPFGPELVGDGPSRLLMTLLITGPFVIAFVLLWLALDPAPTAWLLVRTLSFPLGLAALSALGTWFAARHAAEIS